jgi:two-component system sensor histidine kinase RpfC
LEDWHRHIAALTYRTILQGAEGDTPPPIAVLRKLRILLADDNRSNQLLVARILGDAGHSVRLAERGDHAFDFMAEGNIDLAILDLNMPEMSGPDATKLFRAGEAGGGQRLPIIIVSADATPAARQESLDAGANEYVVKPVAADSLLATIERVVAGVQLRDDPALAVAAAPGTTTALDAQASIAGPVLRREHPARPVLVDPERIDAIRRMGKRDPTFLKQYTDAVFEDLESAIGELRRATGCNDPDAARGALHKIDGTSASIGASALAACAKSMRDYLSTGPDADAVNAVAELSSMCALTKSAVAAVLYQAPATPQRPH